MEEAFHMGPTLRSLRGKRSLLDVSLDSGVSFARLQRMETTAAGRINATLADLEKLARALGMTLADIIEKARVRK